MVQTIMTVEDVAKYLNIHATTVYRLIKETDIPVFRLKGQWRFRKDVLDQWLAKGMSERSAKNLEEKPEEKP